MSIQPVSLTMLVREEVGQKRVPSVIVPPQETDGEKYWPKRCMASLQRWVRRKRMTVKRLANMKKEEIQSLDAQDFKYFKKKHWHALQAHQLAWFSPQQAAEVGKEVLFQLKRYQWIALWPQLTVDQMHLLAQKYSDAPWFDLLEKIPLEKRTEAVGKVENYSIEFIHIYGRRVAPLQLILLFCFQRSLAVTLLQYLPEMQKGCFALFIRYCTVEEIVPYLLYFPRKWKEASLLVDAATRKDWIHYAHQCLEAEVQKSCIKKGERAEKKEIEHYLEELYAIQKKDPLEGLC